MNDRKTYLGDAVYASYDGYMVTLTTEDGNRATNTVHLEPAVFHAFIRWAEEARKPQLDWYEEDDDSEEVE